MKLSALFAHVLNLLRGGNPLDELKQKLVQLSHQLDTTTMVLTPSSRTFLQQGTPYIETMVNQHVDYDAATATVVSDDPVLTDLILTVN